MLPKELSNGCCSLNAGEDRLALSCLMEVDKGGTIGNYEIVESVIRVDKRMSYTQVQKILDGDESPFGKHTATKRRCLQRWRSFRRCFGEAKRARRGGF